ncbi:MAG: hypothetical protein U9R19_03305 [Bacteroidota bacterium]|nr:hypothetical protein [Bacteroidota bacterium]
MRNKCPCEYVDSICIAEVQDILLRSPRRGFFSSYGAKHTIE